MITGYVSVTLLLGFVKTDHNTVVLHQALLLFFYSITIVYVCDYIVHLLVCYLPVFSVVVSYLSCGTDCNGTVVQW